MTKLESIKEQVKQKVGEKTFNKLSSLMDDCKIPSKVEIKMWQKVIDGDKLDEWFNSPLMTEEQQKKHDEFVAGLDEDIQKRGKVAILEVLDKYPNVQEPKLKSILLKHEDLLRELRSENKKKCSGLK